MRIWICLGWFAWATAIACILIGYINSIDDKCFLELCEEEESVHFLRRPEWLVSVGVFALGIAPFLSTILREALIYAGRQDTWLSRLCFPVSLLVVIGVRLWQIHRLYRKWMLQREIQLVAPAEFPSVLVRIAQTAVMFIGMVMVSGPGLSYGLLTIMVAIALTNIVYVIFGAAIGTILAAVLAVWLVRRILRLADRRKFLERLKGMQKKGEISFEIEGHPYLSVFSTRSYFGLRITDWVRAKETDAPKTYLVSVVNLQKRRLTVNLRENHIGQIAHELRLRMTPAQVMMVGQSSKNNLSHPIYTWYTNFSIRFPEGEGEQILVLDPAPYTLYICEGHRRVEGDNGSKVYDYTAWTKNAFANFIERT